MADAATEKWYQSRRFWTALMGIYLIVRTYLGSIGINLPDLPGDLVDKILGVLDLIARVLGVVLPLFSWLKPKK